MNNHDWLSKKLILINGKGGVGKTTLAQETAHKLAASGKKTLLCNVLVMDYNAKNEPLKPESMAPNLWTITLNPSDCFREYIQLKLKLKPLYALFMNNRFIQYLEKVSPGIHELVMTGKIWHERNFYDHIVVDMPSSGYALTMLSTPHNFAELFPGGPIYNDAKAMAETFSDPQQTASVIVSIPEEMPMQESIEFAESLKKLSPQNPPYLIINRVWEELNADEIQSLAKISKNLSQYVLKKQSAQKEILKSYDADIQKLFTSKEILLERVASV